MSALELVTGEGTPPNVAVVEITLDLHVTADGRKQVNERREEALRKLVRAAGVRMLQRCCAAICMNCHEEFFGTQGSGAYFDAREATDFRDFYHGDAVECEANAIRREMDPDGEFLNATGCDAECDVCGLMFEVGGPEHICDFNFAEFD